MTSDAKPDLIDRAELLKKLRKERDAYLHDNFAQDPATGAWEAGDARQEHLDELDEQIELIENFPSATESKDGKG